LAFCQQRVTVDQREFFIADFLYLFLYAFLKNQSQLSQINIYETQIGIKQQEKVSGTMKNHP
jgi:hypothetical protein